MKLYPSITKLHVIDAINFSKKFTKFSDHDTQLILHVSQSVLFHYNKTWCKKNSNSYFDKAMGSFHGVEVCDPESLYLLYKVNIITGLSNMTLYKDDNLGVIDQTSGKSKKIRSSRYTKTLVLRSTLK